VLIAPTLVRDRDDLKQTIRSIRTGGSTALYAGVKLGSRELKKFISDEKVSRVLLLSDGKPRTDYKSVARDFRKAVEYRAMKRELFTLAASGRSFRSSKNCQSEARTGKRLGTGSAKFRP
jgi:Mg-chelatase subunit ChlD